MKYKHVDEKEVGPCRVASLSPPGQHLPESLTPMDTLAAALGLLGRSLCLLAPEIPSPPGRGWRETSRSYRICHPERDFQI